MAAETVALFAAPRAAAQAELAGLWEALKLTAPGGDQVKGILVAASSFPGYVLFAATTRFTPEMRRDYAFAADHAAELAQTMHRLADLMAEGGRRINVALSSCPETHTGTDETK